MRDPDNPTSRERREAKRKKIQRETMADSGYISQYLASVSRFDPVAMEKLQDLMRRFFQTEDGVNILILLENSVLLRTDVLGTSDSALRELHGARNLVAEIRRMAASERPKSSKSKPNTS